MRLFFDIPLVSSEDKVLQPCDILYSRAKLLPISDRLDAFRSNFLKLFRYQTDSDVRNGLS